MDLDLDLVVLHTFAVSASNAAVLRVFIQGVVVLCQNWAFLLDVCGLVQYFVKKGLTN